MTDLAKRAVACARFCWFNGMRDTMGRRVVNGGGEPEDGEQYVQWTKRHGVTDFEAVEDAEPDLDDPATLGCVLALVREAWGPTCSVVHVLDGNGWALITSGGALGLPDLKAQRPTQFHRTYAEGLVAALEAAP